MIDFQTCLDQTKEIGFINSVNNTVISVSGLPHAKPNEIVLLETGDKGYILTLHRELCDVLLFTTNNIKVGIRVVRTNEVLSIPVSDQLLGKTINPFGKCMDPSVLLSEENSFNLIIDNQPLGIGDRKRITQTFETGVAIVDLILPLGQGQRELIIGDKKTGKTVFLQQIMLNQARKGTICIYVAIGKKQLSIKKIEEFMRNQKIVDNCVIVASTAEDAPGVIHMSPYAGMTIAEYFRKQGKNTLVIFDDLTTHAKYYRQVSLLIKRFPGRNAYPGDIFYVHARLLERAGNYLVNQNDGKTTECSITCFPVAETVQGDISGYIQTNLMSITDGHLYFDIDLFSKGRRPPVHPFLSVTRVGKQTQNLLRQTLNREILSFMSMYETMQKFTHFGTEISENIASILATGDRINYFFDHISFRVIPTDLQIFLFSLLWIDVWHDKGLEVMKQDMAKIIDSYNSDSSLRDEIKAMLDKCDSFNNLLGEIRGKPEEFYKKLNLT